MKIRSLSLSLLAGLVVITSAAIPLRAAGQTDEPTRQERLAAKLKELDALNDAFEKKHQSMTDTHPDILALKARIAGVKQDIALLRSEEGRTRDASSSGSGTSSGPARRPGQCTKTTEPIAGEVQRRAVNTRKPVSIRNGESSILNWKSPA